MYRILRTKIKTAFKKKLLLRHFCFNKEPPNSMAYDKNSPKGLKEHVPLCYK